jgi:hypothetical protein
MRQNVWPPDLVSFRHAQEELAAFEKKNRVPGVQGPPSSVAGRALHSRFIIYKKMHALGIC